MHCVPVFYLLKVTTLCFFLKKYLHLVWIGLLCTILRFSMEFRHFYLTPLTTRLRWHSQDAPHSYHYLTYTCLINKPHYLVSVETRAIRYTEASFTLSFLYTLMQDEMYLKQAFTKTLNAGWTWQESFIAFTSVAPNDIHAATTDSWLGVAFVFIFTKIK